MTSEELVTAIGKELVAMDLTAVGLSTRWSTCKDSVGDSIVAIGELVAVLAHIRRVHAAVRAVGAMLEDTTRGV